MVHESISKRFFNRNLHAIDATPARQHGELLRRHRYEFMQRTLGSEEYIVGSPTCDGNDDDPPRTPAGPTTSSRRARGLGHDALTTRERRDLLSGTRLTG